MILQERQSQQHRPATRGRGVGLLGVGLSGVAVVFGLTFYAAVATLDHAVRHAGYFRSFHDASSSGWWSSGPPTYGDAALVFAFGPILQMALFGLIVVGASLRRRWGWRRRLGAATIGVLVADSLLAVFILATSSPI